ncbi:alcohol dehydrogenase catalytic domain-containing protein [Streptomyces sp. NPDC058295]|uniref:alcohol dehydrogenase catalytic domain-containing protein n=1 Tax=Streptomyces sp. NPDC058295 TaxID=3346431 RepID=UPI0036EFF5A9
MRETWPRQLTPMFFGHECGRVEPVGVQLAGFARGDRACLTFASCGTCEQCAAGSPMRCRTAVGGSSHPVDRLLGVLPLPPGVCR